MSPAPGGKGTLGGGGGSPPEHALKGFSVLKVTTPAPGQEDNCAVPGSSHPLSPSPPAVGPAVPLGLSQGRQRWLLFPSTPRTWWVPSSGILPESQLEPCPLRQLLSVTSSSSSP
jgi:hypothetical protein